MDPLINKINFETNEQGFLVNAEDWTEDVANRLAESENIQLNDESWEIIFFIRNYYHRYKHLPNMRVFTKVIVKIPG